MISMVKTSDLAAAFVKQSQSRIAPISRPPINAFSSLFSIQESTEEEYLLLENLLTEGEGGLNESIRLDVDQLARITQEVKAIKKQEMLLIGERISLARDIFKKYKEKGFRRWLESTFGSFKTGYNYLSFYDLYLSIPESLQDLLKEMPAKAAYVLASKKVSIEQKAEIVKEHSKESAKSIIASIHDAFGLDVPVKKNPSNIDIVLVELEKQIGRLFLLSQKIGLKQKKKISHLIDKLQKIGSV
jgi:hypothetical protein